MKRRARNFSPLIASHWEALESRTLLSGSWTALAHNAPGGIGTMMLMPDGSVIAPDQGVGTGWARLVPAANGSYLTGTWSQIASEHDTRLYDSTQVLPNGNLFIAGGEYGTGAATGEIYNPLTNAWTELPTNTFGTFLDSQSMLLANGTVMITPVYPSKSGYTTIYNPAPSAASAPWSQGPKLYRGGDADEQGFVKLADNSILTIDSNSTSERYIPAGYPGAGAAANTWINDGAVPVKMFDGLGEIGPGVRLSDGRVFYMGATDNTAIYTPSGTTAPGTWVAGPTIPGGLGDDDAPAAVLPDGTVLCVAGPSGTYNGPTSFFIYTPDTNGGIGSFASITAPPGASSPPFVMRMLTLPDGTVLWSNGGSTLYEYNPGVAPLAAAVPVLNAFTAASTNSNGTFTISGTGLNGIDAGSAYGDDAQMDSNYPIVKMVSTGGTVYYATSSAWSSYSTDTTGVAETATVTLPLGIPAGTFSVSVVGNGVASNTEPLTVSMTAGNTAPTVATAAAASPSPTDLTTTNLSVLGADDAGESDLIYTWTTTSVPSGAALPSFSINGTNAAKATTATFSRAGAYSFKVYLTDAGGLSVTSTVSIAVTQTETRVTLTPAAINLSAGTTQQFSAIALDQFGNSMATQPVFTWFIPTGGGSISTAGQYTAPTTGTLATIKVADATAHSATSQVNVVSAPWLQSDIGAPTVAGSAYDSAGTFHVTSTGKDVGGTTDQFHFVYQTLTGDGSITARVATQTGINAAKAGVMIRNSLTANDADAYMTITPGNGADFLYRATSGAAAVAATATTGIVAPYWVRVVRIGETFTGYISSDGINWVNTGSATITMGATAYFGLEVSSDVPELSSSVTFDHVSLNAGNSAPVLSNAAANPSTVTAKSTVLSVTGSDDGGEANLTYTWATTGNVPAAVSFDANNGTNAGKNETVTFSKAGTYSFLVTATDLGGASTTITTPVTVSVSQTLTTITILPATPSINENATQQFSATGYDQFGVALSAQPTSFAWATHGAGDSISASGVFASTTTAGTGISITATADGVTGTASINVVNAAPTLANAKATPATVPAKTTVLSVTGSDDGGEANLKYTWSTTGTVPAAVAFNANNGTNAGKSTTATFSEAGTYHFLVTAADAGGLTATITTAITVTVNQTETSLALSPTSATPAVGKTQQFAASALDQFGQKMATQPTAFTWSIPSGGGTISTGGLYTAPAAGTLASVKAVAGSFSGTAKVTVVSAPWTQSDIGSPAHLGTGYDSAGTFTVTGAGSDIWNKSDQFHFVYRTLTGDGSITARVATQSNTNTWAKAGVMVRNSLSAADAMVDMFVTPGQGADMQYRKTSGASAAQIAATKSLVAPYWVRIVRVGNVFTSYRSATGAAGSWTNCGAVTIAMGTTAYFGLEVCSHNTSAASTATFDHVTLSQAKVATAAAATPSTVPLASTAALSVLGSDPNGESNLTYTWLATTVPAGGVVTYSGTTNGSNAAKKITAKFSVAGAYTLTVTITDGIVSTTSKVTVMVV